MLPNSKHSGCSLLPATQTSLVPFRTLIRAMLRRPGDYEPMGCLCISVLVCLFLSVFACFFVCACASLTSYACFYVLLCMFLCVCLCVSMFLCVCLCHCERCICLWDYVSENAFVCVCLCQCRVEHHLGCPSEGEAYRPICTIHSFALINGIQLSSPL